jgi:hypothetical protein
MVLATQNALFTGNKKVMEARNRTRAHITFPDKAALRFDPDPTPAVSNRLYTARYELGPYRVSVHERLGISFLGSVWVTFLTVLVPHK